MTQRRALVVVLLVALLSLPGAALAEQESEEGHFLVPIEQLAQQLWDWMGRIAGIGAETEPKGEPTKSEDTERPLERIDAQQRIGAHSEPEG